MFFHLYVLKKLEKLEICRTVMLPPMVRSMTRFGEISPIWQYSTSLWEISKSLNWYLAELHVIFGKLICFWANVHCYKCPNIDN